MGATATWSEFLRDPNRVIETMEADGSVTLVRRSAPPVRLSDADAAVAAEETLGALTLLLSLALDDDMLTKLVSKLTFAFPWIELLPETQRPEFVADFLHNARAGFAIGRLDVLTATLAAWRDTATAYADSRIRVDGSDLHYLENAVPVPDPKGDE
ncbi:hypothetical protein [Nocardia arthritidis]|uniref:Prevent-host-death protein n=1 Tax=Nocardia arthritidis TaxID=228602 RepID=A0A6G9YSV1_9NOCA|nr:hypothetical protein [Nocardia arthritidis]QIS16395.1 hypothetical protein F5544_42935 [Nocardia arthritidis]